mmetsp:Transcript_48793/g.87880  ORF Transcript_48793/g.87880 Transcript_48793/m.87880 type:complete len:135 (-) Transcript_48793:33-437(-)
MGFNAGKCLAILDMICGIVLLLNGVWMILWWIQWISDAPLSLVVTGAYYIFFGGCIIVWAVKGLDLVDNYTKLMTVNGGKAFTFFYFGLSGAGYMRSSSFFAIGGAILIGAGITYLILQFVPACKGNAASKVCS